MNIDFDKANEFASNLNGNEFLNEASRLISLIAMFAEMGAQQAIKGNSGDPVYDPVYSKTDAENYIKTYKWETILRKAEVYGVDLKLISPGTKGVGVRLSRLNALVRAMEGNGDGVRD